MTSSSLTAGAPYPRGWTRTSVFAAAIPFLELCVQLGELFLAEICAPLLRHEFLEFGQRRLVTNVGLLSLSSEPESQISWVRFIPPAAALVAEEAAVVVAALVLALRVQRPRLLTYT